MEHKAPAKVIARRKADRPHTVVYGNPFDGLKIVGPFVNADEAQEYGEQHDHGDNWWIVPLRRPED